MGHRVPGGRRGLRHLDQGDRPAARARGAHRRQQGRALRQRQLLDDGRHRPLRPLLGDLLRPRPGDPRRPARQPGRGRRPLHRDLEPRVHAVRHAARRQREAAAGPLRGHRHGPGAAGRRAAARAQQLRDRPVRRADQGRRARDRLPGPGQPLAARDRRPHPRHRLPGQRWRDPGQRRPRLRAAPHRAPRHPPRLQARPQAAVLPQAGARPGGADGRGLPAPAGGGASASARCSRPRRSASSRRWKTAWRSSMARSAAARRCCPATWPSSCTTPMASRST